MSIAERIGGIFRKREEKSKTKTLEIVAGDMLPGVACLFDDPASLSQETLEQESKGKLTPEQEEAIKKYCQDLTLENS